MKIGIFTDSYKPYTSGVVTSIATFKEELTRLGHNIYIFAPSYPNYEEKEENVYRYYSLPAPTNRDYTLAIPVYPGMNMLLKKLNLDIIHVQSPFTMGRVGMHYARRHDIPILFTYHTLYSQYAHYFPVAQDLAKEVAIKYSNNFCNQCDHVIVPSTEVEEILTKYKIKTPISVIPTGVPIQKFTKGDRNWLQEHFHIPADRKVLLFVGRLTKEKNLEFLIKAFNQVKERKPLTTLVITAQGPIEGELKKLTTELGLSLKDDVVFTGALPFETLVNVYYSSDLFVFSSMTETQGLVLIEAMAAGLPVVAVRAYGVQDMVDSGKNGLLTECELDEFSDAICHVLNDEDLYNKFKLNALKKAESLSSTNMAKKVEKLYLGLSKTNTRHRSKMADLLSWFG
ncbi:MAG: glycosyltransferase family 4 protein [Syntrophomonadaceae bacterium]|nr:glycosyltransferase family 4 protein [Syntrophomonadaceae bacterium]MDD3890602.1 glycosyltransferase family 4 protein [Syntrophomonadaceae bacterium]MDD4549732.1 glycosyltransferase family 4 protein [Syntrophomonadaceae bacterium]